MFVCLQMYNVHIFIDKWIKAHIQNIRIRKIHKIRNDKSHRKKLHGRQLAGTKACKDKSLKNKRLHVQKPTRSKAHIRKASFPLKKLFVSVFFI